jgi:hypothetical protein
MPCHFLTHPTNHSPHQDVQTPLPLVPPPALPLNILSPIAASFLVVEAVVPTPGFIVKVPVLTQGLWGSEGS